MKDGKVKEKDRRIGTEKDGKRE